MVHLLSVHDAFHARVIAARLGSDGILTQLRGAVDGPYPVLGEIRVYVDEEDLPVARELLLADEVESAFEQPAPVPHERRASGVPVWVAIVVVVLLASMYLTEGL